MKFQAMSNLKEAGLELLELWLTPLEEARRLLAGDQGDEKPEYSLKQVPAFVSTPFLLHFV
jgi:hypothetical protein